MTPEPVFMVSLSWLRRGPTALIHKRDHMAHFRSRSFPNRGNAVAEAGLVDCPDLIDDYLGLTSRDGGPNPARPAEIAQREVMGQTTTVESVPVHRIVADHEGGLV